MFKSGFQETWREKDCFLCFKGALWSALVFFSHNWTNKLFSKENKVPEHKVWSLPLRLVCLISHENKETMKKKKKNFLFWLRFLPPKNYKTSPNFPSTWGWADNDSTFSFGWTFPLNWHQIKQNKLVSPDEQEALFKKTILLSVQMLWQINKQINRYVNTLFNVTKLE